MMDNSTKAVCGIAFLVLAVFWGCTEEMRENPFDEQENNQDTVRLELIDPDPNTIGGIYVNVFRPTCANVGCHDGNFEPDFRTIESAYNTLVFQEPIKNDGNYEYRVHPGKPDESVIMARLNNLISPSMPIQLEPESDWYDKGEEYIENIRTWIANGAKDMAGQLPKKNHPAPKMLGAMAMWGDSVLTRVGGTGPIRMPITDEEVAFYFSFSHAEMDPRDFSQNKVVFSTQPEGFDTIPKLDLEVLPAAISGRGFYGETVEFTHRVRIQPESTFDPEIDQWYFRVYVKDEENPVTEIPTNDGIYYVKRYMSFQWEG